LKFHAYFGSTPINKGIQKSPPKKQPKKAKKQKSKKQKAKSKRPSQAVCFKKNRIS
jgi:hypothetical protein